MSTEDGLRRLIDLQRKGSTPVYRDHCSSRTLTGADLGAALTRWQPLVAELGGAPVVALSIADPLGFTSAYLGLLAAGATVAPLDPAAPPPLLHQDLAELGADALVTETGDGPSVSVLRTRKHGRPSEQGAVLLRSSGSTGPRKLIRLPEAQLLHVARAVAGAHELGPGDVGYSPLPLFHVNAEVVGLLATLVARSTLVLGERFSRKHFWPCIAEHHVTWINAVPAILAIMEHEGDPARGVPPGCGQVRFARSASAPLPVPVLQRFEKTFGIPVLEAYGMTEAASQICANPLTSRRPGSVGVPIAVDLEVRDQHGAPVGPETLGEVHIRGRGVIAGALPGAWLATGDLGRRDAQGYLYLTGRVSEVINRGGEKLFPRDIEDVLLRDSAISAVAVVGEEDAMLGEVPVAYVVAHSPERAAEVVTTARQRCEHQLRRPQRPAAIHVVGELPRGATGKISRRQVRELADDLVEHALASA
ncbi:MAG: AMP-binding protein [Mycobacteriaceae bacterium]